MADHETDEVLFIITKEVEAEMDAAGHVFELPSMITLGRDPVEKTSVGRIFVEPEGE